MLSLDILITLSVGNVYIADPSSNRIRKVEISTSIITTVAGSGGTGSYSGDGGDATAAALYNPSVVAVDASGTRPISLLDVRN